MIMSAKKIKQPDYIFETGWEVCNKIGGIHTVISTKAPMLTGKLSDQYIVIGPDVWKETHRNPEFIEDQYLFRSWREHAGSHGLHFRIGRWQVPGNPVAILVDFTPLFGQKNEIFKDYWDKFELNSLSGQWDYTEPALFGYAAGQVIESFYHYYMTAHDHFIAHFHEWLTGTGVLYLKDRVPQASTVFTTHATVLGRSIAARGQDSYSLKDDIDPGAKAAELGVASKFSLEKLAARHADSFTTVSEVTAAECNVFLDKDPDVITHNGFHKQLIASGKDNAESRVKSRQRLLEVAKGMLNTDLSDDSLLLVHSGRYEFRNKGTDILIDALGELNKQSGNQTVVAFILIPSTQGGPLQDVAKRIESPDYANPVSGEYLTHRLADPEKDAIIQRLKQAGLENKTGDHVRIVFSPAYLNGNDGLYNIPYYDMLSGFDVSAFPSYYEPWGYTPMESMARKVPTITSSLSGFGQWIMRHQKDYEAAIHIPARNDHNDQEITTEIAGIIRRWMEEAGNSSFTGRDHDTDPVCHKSLLPGRERAAEIIRELVWEKQFTAYEKSFVGAVEKATSRYEQYKDKKQPVKEVKLPPAETMRPKWKKVTVEINVPEELKALPVLAKNIWWTWNYEAQDLFESIDPDLWEQCEKNPITLLENLGMEHFESLRKNDAFLAKYKEVVKKFNDYMEEGRNKKSKQIAYFSMEYGLHDTIKIYSGGLGVLAGDYLKQASDDNVDMVGIGLLYRYGYFTQSLSVHGEQVDTFHPHNFSKMSAAPVRDKNGDRIKISIAFPGRTLHARVYRIDVGRIPLYLLDTDISENAPADRFITHQLYGGDWENRFKQEFLLGIGGIRLLDALNLNPSVYHCNEGHAAFTGLERLRKYVQEEGVGFHEAIEVVRASSLFTTHTPVPAGHDFFSEDMLRTYMPHYADRLGISWEEFIRLGKTNPDDTDEDYSMSVLATRMSREVNGVSKIHGEVSRNMFKDLYPGYFPEELHIGHVTNGVHYGTWTAKEWQELFSKTFGKDFLKNVADPDNWARIYEVPDQEIWEIRNKRRKALLDYIKQRLLNNLSRRQETPRRIYQVMEAIDPNTLTIGFARRFATYKRAHLLFNDLDRLSKIVNNPDMPVQFIYAGKAHPADKAGQELIKHILDISKRKEFHGKILFLEDYDMELGRELVKGVDIWLNTPTRPQEASGTSGQKAALNGVMNFSVLDGWWAEGYQEETGWMLKEEKTFDNQDFQNELDAETIYNTLESEIAPMYYKRDSDGIPKQWVRWIKNCIARVAPHFTNKRMLDDYFAHFYNKLFESAEEMRVNNYSKARELVHWKHRVLNGWDGVEVVSKKLLSNSGKTLLLGQPFVAELTLDLKNLKESDFGVEVVFVRKSVEGSREIMSVYEMEPGKTEGNNQVTYKCEIAAKHTGAFNYAFRMFPRHQSLAHRQDFNLIRWI